MKGIIKGSVFSTILIFIIICIIAVINMNTKINPVFLKGGLWILLGLCIFLGCLPVSRSGKSKKILRGLFCALLTIVVLFITVSIASKNIPNTGHFYAFSIIMLISGFLGALTGATKQ